MRIRIDYTTAYEYARAASSVVQLLRVQPRGGWDQHVGRWRVDVDADGSLRPGTDVFGNATHLFTAAAPITRLTMTVTGEVDTDQCTRPPLPMFSDLRLVTGRRKVATGVAR